MDIKIKTFLDEQDNSYQGFMIGKLEDNVIYYDEENINVAILLESDKITLSRETNEYKLELVFSSKEPTKGLYIIKELSSTMELEINTLFMLVKDNLIELRYLINTKEKESYFRLEYEVL